MAQSNASGTVVGRVEGTPGASVVLVNTETGLRRTGTVDAGGRFQVTALPPGHYRVDLLQNGNVVRSNEVDVLLGQGVDASFLSANMQTVQVTGRRSRIDLTTAANGTVFTAKELAKLPVQQNLTSIVLLAPNTTKGDPAFGNTASFGGGGVSENSFYLNGFPITNPLSQLGSMELPFGAIQQANVLTGGFGAEFGRSIGGVLNVTSKSGTNTWEAGAMASVEPNAWRASRRNITYADGELDYRRDNRETSSRQYGGFVGGPIIKDKLFMFVSADQTIGKDAYVGSPSSATASTIGESGWFKNRTWENRWLAKVDWNINDDHRLEFTSAGDDYRGRYQKYGYALDSTAEDANGLVSLAGHPTDVLYSSAVARNLGPTDAYYPQTPGSKLNMLRYNGQLNDDLSITALYGVLKTSRGTTYEAAGQNTGGVVPPGVSVINYVGGTGAWPAFDPNLFRTHNVFPGNRAAPGKDQTKAGRFDVEYKLGDHTLRAGIDSVKIDVSGAGVATSGGLSWSYRWVGLDKNGNSQANVARPLSFSRPAVVANYGGSGLDGYYVRSNIFSSITDASAKQTAQYIEDKWQVSKNVQLNLGLRNDSYSNSNGDGEKFVDMKSQVAPRLSAIWDVNGDSSLKVYGSAGRYYLQLPTQVAARAASRSTYLNQDFTYTGIDPATGAPLGLVAINTQQSPDGEYNQRKDPRSVVVKDLKPNYQDELTLGFDKTWSPELNFGAKVTYRRLGAGIDDSCDTRPILDFAERNGIDIQAPGAVNCFIYNPGEEVTLWVDGNDKAGNPVVTGKGQYATFSPAVIGEPKAKRNYAALDMYLEHPMRNGWFGRINYTLSRSTGNMEGQTRSDSGQTDVGTSAAWDFPEFAPGSDGLLPNDRKHQLKAFGVYQLTPEWSVGGFATIQSGRPRLCLGTNNASEAGENPDFPFGAIYGGPGYGAEYYFCGGKPSPRGSLGRLPWEKRLDLNLAYTPAMLKGLAVKLDVFNALNSQRPITQESGYDDGDESLVSAYYGQYTAYQAPRSMKLTVEFNKKF